MRNHTIVVGYGTKGRTAVAAMIGDEVAPARHRRRRRRIRAALERAKSAGLVTVRGNATDSEVLRLAERSAREVDHRRHQPRRHRGAGHADRARARAERARSSPRSGRPRTSTCCEQSGADSTVVTVGDGGSAARHRHHRRPSVVEMMEDLLTPRRGLRDRRTRGRGRRRSADRRGICPTSCSVWCATGHLLRVDAPEVDALELGDRLLYIRSADVRADEPTATALDFSCATSRCCRASAPTGPTPAHRRRRGVAGWADALLLRVDSRNQVLIADGRVVLGKAAALARSRPATRGVPGPARRRPARVGGPRRAGGARGSRRAKPRCSTCAGPARSSTTPAPNWCRRPPRC